MTESIRQYYETNPHMISSPFGGVTVFNDALFAEVMRALAIDLGGCSLLDIGCGRGMAAGAVHAAGGRYTGVDLACRATGVRMAAADGHHLPFRDAQFDAVFCIDAFEHFPDPAQGAREMRRVLRAGGYVFLSTPHYANMAGLVKRFCERFGGYTPNTWAPFGRWQPQEHEAFVTPVGITRLFRGAGFQRVRWIGYPREAGLGLFPWMDHPRMPESIRLRLQRFFAMMGPGVVKVWPGSSLHGFWKIEA